VIQSRNDEIKGLLWDEHNVAHIGRHDVTPEEVEEVVFANTNLVELAEDHRPGRLSIFGWTHVGRPVVVYLDVATNEGHRYVVTARPMTNREALVAHSRLEGTPDA